MSGRVSSKDAKKECKLLANNSEGKDGLQVSQTGLKNMGGFKIAGQQVFYKMKKTSCEK